MVAMMRCGHAAQGRVMATHEPACIICAPQPEAREVVPADEVATLVAGREMRCSYRTGRNGKPCPGRTPRPSNPDAPFFRLRADAELDEFYDGCWGWD